ncbi:Uncharacterised protein [Mycobacteroides abscessus subsp. abscessus]|nr:Uncharacterised protein [Mycobacteroides abscessus subsp. abscessus]
MARWAASCRYHSSASTKTELTDSPTTCRVSCHRSRRPVSRIRSSGPQRRIAVNCWKASLNFPNPRSNDADGSRCHKANSRSNSSMALALDITR